MKKNTEENIVLVITGSKCDLEDQRAVQVKEYMILKKEYGAIGEETSSKSN